MRGVEFYGLLFVWRRSFEHSAGSLDWKLSSNIWSMHWYTSMLLVIMAVHCLIYLGNHRAWSHPPISRCLLCVTSLSAPPQAFTISKVIYRVSTLQKTKIWKIYHKSQLRHDFPNFFQCLEVYCKRHQGRYRQGAIRSDLPLPNRRAVAEDWRLGAAGLGESRAAQGDARSLSCDHLLLQGGAGGLGWAPSQWPKCGDDRKHRCWDGFLAGAIARS